MRETVPGGMRSTPNPHGGVFQPGVLEELGSCLPDPLEGVQRIGLDRGLSKLLEDHRAQAALPAARYSLRSIRECLRQQLSRSAWPGRVSKDS